jgi:hypothetical protein
MLAHAPLLLNATADAVLYSALPGAEISACELYSWVL